MEKRWHRRLFHGPVLLFLILTFAPLYLYVIIRNSFPNKKLKLFLVVCGVIFSLIQILLAGAILFLNRTELFLPPWSDKIFLLWAATVCIIFLVMVSICQYIKQKLTRWIFCLSAVIAVFAVFLYMSNPMDYIYAFGFRLPVNATVIAHFDNNIEEYKECGNYIIAGKMQATDVPNVSSESNNIIIEEYQFALPESFEKKEAKYCLAKITSDESRILFFKPYDFLEELNKATVQTAGFMKSDEIQAANNFADNYELIHEMLMTTFDDVRETDTFESLARKEMLYVTKVTALAMLPPVYEFDNGDVKGFLGKNKAKVFDDKNRLLFDITIWSDTPTDNAKAMTEYLKQIVFSIRKNSK